MCCKWLLLVSFITVIVKLCYNFVLEKLSSLGGHVPSLQSWKNKGGRGLGEDEWNGGWVSSANVDNLRISYLLSFFSRFLFTETLHLVVFIFQVSLAPFCQTSVNHEESQGILTWYHFFLPGLLIFERLPVPPLWTLYNANR